jgi:thymidylate synthase (FAD)
MGVVNAARVSPNASSGEIGDKEVGLINFLMREKHGTPFEHNMFTFLCEVPIFVQREQMRHRIGHSYNEHSARYSKMEPKFYIPDYVRTQEGLVGAYNFEPIADHLANEFRLRLENSCRGCYEEYEKALLLGVAREQARYFLHVNTFTKYYWTCNARSLMHFIGLRNRPQEMWEISQVAKEAELTLSVHMPATHEKFMEYGRKAP